MIEIGEDVEVSDALRELARLMERVDESFEVRARAAMLFACGIEMIEVVKVPNGKRAQLAEPFWGLLEEAA